MIAFIEEHYIELITTLALIGIEIAPIKFSPITLIGQLFSSWLGITKLDTKLNKLNEEVDNNELDRIRFEILQFSTSLRQGIKRTEVEYRHIEDIFEKYTSKGGNSYILHEMEYIRTQHDEGMIL